MAQSRPVDPVTLQPLPDDRSPALLARRASLMPTLSYEENQSTTQNEPSPTLSEK